MLLVLLLLCLGLALTLGYPGRGANSMSSEPQLPVSLRDGVPAPDQVAISPADMRSIPASPWLEQRKKRYAGLFKDTQCELLVVPVQVEGSAFDRPNRYIMTADLATSLAASGKCVADPYLVDIALADAFRRRSTDEVQALARSMNARTIVSAFAGHTAPGHMRVTIQVSAVDGATGSVAHSFDQYTYDDEHPPFEVFRQHLPEMLAAVGLTQQPAGEVSAGALSERLPDSFAPFLHPAREHSVGPLQQAADLALLGMLVPYNQWPVSDRLMSKAWAALERADDKDPVVRRFRARIMFHLRERPMALSQIKDDDSAEAEGLRAVLNGSLPQARLALDRVKGEWDRAFLGLEVHDLELIYYRDGRETARRVNDIFAGSPFAPFAERRLKDNNAWSLGSTLPFKRVLDEALPLDGFAVADTALGGTLMSIFDRPALELSALRHIHRLMTEQPRLWCCSSFSLAAAPSDLLDLLESRVEHTLGRQAYYYVNPQGRYAEALDVLRNYDDELAGDPRAEELRAIIYWNLLNQGELDKREELSRKMHEAARLSAWLEQAQTLDESYDFWYMNLEPKDPLLASLVKVTDDYPMRDYWDWNLHRPTAQDRLPFSVDEIGPLKALLQAADAEQRPRYLAELDARFIGSPEATNLRLDNTPPERKTPEFFGQEIARDPDNWDLRNALAKMELEREDFAKAKDAILAYPPFQQENPDDPVKLSNYASNWGHDLLWLGALDQARPLLERSAAYQTGSAGGGFSEARLALLDHRAGTAAEAFGELARHYTNFVGWRELDSLLFASGRDRAGWSLFDEISGRYRNYGFWTAAMVGHRRAATGDAELGQWYAARLDKMHDGQDRDNLRACAFLEWSVDRSPSQAFVDAMQSLASPGEAAMRGGKTYLDHTSAGVTVELGPFGLHKSPLDTSAPLPDRYQLAAQAMLAVHQEQYEQAVSLFDRLGTYYKFENTNLNPLLPYFALAAAKTGDTLKLRAYLDQLPPAEQQYETRLARAVFAGLAGQRDDALALLQKDFHRWAYVYGDHFPMPAYQYMAICTLLYEQTRDEAYRTAALRLARPFRLLEPAFAYGHALVAYLGQGDEERTQALATALYLDPRSEWAAKAPPSLQAAARAWLIRHPDPFPEHDNDWGWSGEQK